MNLTRRGFLKAGALAAAGVLEEIGGENYAEYSQRYDAYMKAAEEMFGGGDFDGEEPTCAEGDGMAMQ